MGAVKHWQAPTTPSPVHATVTVPGSKSQTNRALVLAALATAQGTSTISGALRSRDTDLMIGAVRTLGVTVDGDDTELTVSGRIAPPAGATRRLRPRGHGAAIRPAGRGAVHRDGGVRRRRAGPRPPDRAAAATRCAGSAWTSTATACRSRSAATERCAGGTVEIDASASSQFVSGLLLSGASFTDGLTIVHTGESVPSAPHVAMTVAMLREAGVDVDDTQANRWRVSPGPIAARHWVIEPDLSNAVPFLAAAVVSGGIVRIAGWPR